MLAEHVMEELLSSNSKHLYCLIYLQTDVSSFLFKKNNKNTYNLNCNWRASGLRKNSGRQHRDTFTYLKQQRMTCPSILSALQNEIHMIRHPCTLWYVLFAHFCQSHPLSSLLSKRRKKSKAYFFLMLLIKVWHYLHYQHLQQHCSSLRSRQSLQKSLSQVLLARRWQTSSSSQVLESSAAI